MSIAKSHLKRYRLKITTLSPVHIGSGTVIHKKEYINDRRNVYYPNLREMTRALRERGSLADYESFLFAREGDLARFLTDQRINWQSFSGKPVSVRGVVDNKDRFNEINTFIKDPYGLPYVPGTSVKGAFRTIMLHNEAWTRRKNGENFGVLDGKDPRGAKQKGSEIEKKLLYTLRRNERIPNHAANDMMSAFRFGDSEPISRDAIIICRKVDLVKNVSKKLGNFGELRLSKLPTFRECLKPGTIINLTVTVDESLLHNSKHASLAADFSARFKEALKNFNTDYDYEFRSMFVDDSSAENTIFLGCGTGFIAKTILLGLFETEQWVKFSADYLDGKFRKHGHLQDKKLGVSPRALKLTEFQAKEYEMGKCLVEITEM